MKKIVIAIMCFFMSSSIALAGEYTHANNEDEYGAVQYFDFDFDVERDGNIVKLRWDDFPSGEGFQWYKVMYSTTVAEPVYPDQNAVYVGTKRTSVSHKIALKDGEYHYFRICAITMSDDYEKARYCSKVKKIVADWEEKEYVKEEKKKYTQRYKDIEYYDFDFQVEVADNGYAKTRWNSYLQDRGFKYYKLLYSTKYVNPSYPELSAKHVSSKILDSEKSFKVSSGEKHYFRICAITDEGYGVTGRYCSHTKKVVLENNSAQTDHVKEKYETTYTKTQETKVSSDLSRELQEKIEDRIGDFIETLEEKDYSDQEIVAVIDNVIDKLESYKTQARYKAMASYMQHVLEMYRGEYEDELDVFDEIFGEYKEFILESKKP